MTDKELIQRLELKLGKGKKANGHWIMFKCPTCIPKDASKMRRGINLQTLKTKCWICEQKLTLKEILVGEKIERVTGPSVIEEIPEHPQARAIPADQIIPINELPDDHPAVQLFKKDHLHNLDRYWNENLIGFIPAEGAQDIVWEKESGNTSLSPADALIFPVLYNKEQVGWQLRYVPGTPNGDRMHKLRYLHIFKKGDYLYNFDNAIKYSLVIVVEGVKKALKFPNAVATFGKGISDDQIQKLLQWKEIVFMYDGDDITQKKTQQLVEELNMGSHRCICIDPRKYGYDSPDEMPEDIAQKIVYLEWRNQTK